MLKKRIFNFEKGSISIYVIATVFCFLIILGGIYASSSNTRKNELKTLIKIKEIYKQDIKISTEEPEVEPTQKEYYFDYTGAEQLFVAPANGRYKLQVWGAQGGEKDSTYAKGGKRRVFLPEQLH